MAKKIFQVVLDPDLHSRVDRAANLERLFLKEIVARACESECEKVERKHERRREKENGSLRT